MRKFLLRTSILILVVVATASCAKIKDALTQDVTIENKELYFNVAPTAKSSSANAIEEILYEGTLTINVKEVVEANGLSFDQLKDFAITMGSVELMYPTGFDMGQFNNIKLYFDNREQLVAQANKVEGGVVKLSIVNGNLLNKLKEDQLNVIVVGNRPSSPVMLKLVTSYKAKVSLLN